MLLLWILNRLFPTVDIVDVWSLSHKGIQNNTTRIREGLYRVDPDGVAIRWATVIEHRKYKIMSPLSLWHCDGNQKLIR